MKYSYGTIIAIASALFFYIRLILLQRQKVKQLSNPRKSSDNKNRPQYRQNKSTADKIKYPKLEFSSPYLLGLGIILILIGGVFSAVPWFIPEVKTIWWIPVTIGIILMSISIH